MKKILVLMFSLFLALFLVACDETENNSQGDSEPESVENEPENNENENVGNNANENEEPENVEDEPEEVEEPENESDDVSREYRNALQAAQNYIDIMAFSEKGLFEQLTSEYGDQYPEDAAQYAIENVEVDYNEEALEAAESYQEIMPMSDQELLDQLTSEYGDQYTQEQAQYALDNLDD